MQQFIQIYGVFDEWAEVNEPNYSHKIRIYCVKSFFFDCVTYLSLYYFVFQCQLL